MATDFLTKMISARTPTRQQNEHFNVVGSGACFIMGPIDKILHFVLWFPIVISCSHEDYRNQQAVVSELDLS